MRTTRFRLAVSLVVTFVLGLAWHAAATPPPRPWACECAYIEAPVLCPNGVVYINPCVASCFGQEDCEPYGSPDPLP